MNRPRSIISVFVLLVVFCSNFGCDADVPWDQRIIAEPEIEIVVHQTDEEVIFEFFIQKPTPTGSLVRVRHAPGSVSVADKSGRAIWDIHVLGFRVGATRVQYGVLPEGFEQWIPKKGGAPALEIDKEYRAFAYSSGGGEATFIYKGADEKTK